MVTSPAFVVYDEDQMVPDTGEFNESDVTNKLACIEEKTRKFSQPLKKLNFRFI